MLRRKLNETPATMLPLLRSRMVRILLVAAPAVTAMAAILSAVGDNLALGIVLNAAAGVTISSALFLAVSSVAREVADERVFLAQTVEQEHWHVRAQRLFPRHKKDGNLYADWYFRLRLQEEMERAKRYNVPLSVVLAKKPGLNVSSQAGGWLGADLQEHLRRTDLPALLRDGSLGVILPHTASGAALPRRLMKALASVNAQVGLATFPEDGGDVSSLLRAADQAADKECRDGRAEDLAGDRLAA